MSSESTECIMNIAKYVKFHEKLGLRAGYTGLIIIDSIVMLDTVDNI